MSPNSKIMRVSEAIAPDLMFRGVADVFFDELEQTESKKLTLDFTAVKSVSRSFAHQYSIRKKSSRKEIKEINMSEEIARMFELVNRNQRASRMTLPRVSRAQVIAV